MDSATALPFSELIHLPNFRVGPVQWSQAHLDLVGCRFEDTWEQVESHGPEQQQGSVVHDDDDDGAWVDLTRRAPVSEQKRLERQFVAHIRQGPVGIKTLFMEHLLMEGESLFVEVIDEIKFFWCGRIAHRPRMKTFGGVQRPGATITESPCFLVGYYVHTHDEPQCYTCRWEKMGPSMQAMLRDPRGLADSCPMARWPVNPYVLSLLVALAQAQEDLNTRKFGRTPIQKVCLLVSNPAHRDFIHLYEATIPDEIIDAMFRPHRSTQCIDWPTVTHKTINFEPRDTFKARLHAEMALVSQDPPAAGPGVGQTSPSDEGYVDVDAEAFQTDLPVPGSSRRDPAA